MRCLFTLVLAIFVTVSPALAADERDELKARFQQRHEQLLQLKQDGRIGETWLGYVEAIDDALVERSHRQLIQVENADRKRLYELIAMEVVPGREKIPASVVADRNARRNFERAQPDHWLRVEEGRWVQKRDENRYVQMKRFKRDGKIGETAQGYAEAVPSSGPADAQVRSLLDRDREARTELYKRIAEARGRNATVERVAQDAGKEILKHIAPGEYYKPQRGDWVQQPRP